MKKIATVIFSFLSISCAAQSSGKYPTYFNSAALEFVNPLGYISSHNFNRLPPVFLSLETRLSNKFYGEAGISFGDPYSGFYIEKNLSHYHETAMNCYAGALFKQKLFRNFYFTPSLDFYYSLMKRFYGDSLYQNINTYSIGPTLGFEYFISKRISVNTDLLNIDAGLYFDSENPYSGYSQTFIQEHLYFNIYKLITLGIHYNFDWKKADKQIIEAK